MAIVSVGIDLAKNVFAVHGVSETGKAELVRPEVPRVKLLKLIANLPPMLDRHGSLLGRPPLGQGMCPVWPHGASDGPQVRRPLPHGRQAQSNLIR